MNLAIIRRKYRFDGGAEKIIHRCIDAFPKDVNSTLITENWSGSPNCEIAICKSKGISRHTKQASFAKSVMSYLQTHPSKYDIIQSHERIPGCHIYRAGDGSHHAWLDIKRKNQSLLQNLWQNIDPFHRLMLECEHDLVHHPALKSLICISEMVKEDFLRYYPDAKNKLSVIHCGIDLNDFHPSATHRTDIRNTLNIKSNEQLGIFVGSGFHRKGLDLAIKAMAHVSNNVKLIALGHDKHIKQYEKLIHSLGLSERVLLLGKQSNVKEYLSAADFCVHPARYEPFGNAVLEAMACGKPVILTNKTGSQDMIEQGINGYIVESEDVTGIAQSINNMTNQNLIYLSQAARASAENFSIEKMVGAMSLLYQQIL